MAWSPDGSRVAVPVRDCGIVVFGRNGVVVYEGNYTAVAWGDRLLGGKPVRHTGIMEIVDLESDEVVYDFKNGEYANCVNGFIQCFSSFFDHRTNTVVRTPFTMIKNISGRYACNHCEVYDIQSGQVAFEGDLVELLYDKIRVWRWNRQRHDIEYYLPGGGLKRVDWTELDDIRFWDYDYDGRRLGPAKRFRKVSYINESSACGRYVRCSREGGVTVYGIKMHYYSCDLQTMKFTQIPGNDWFIEKSRKLYWMNGDRWVYLGDDVNITRVRPDGKVALVSSPAGDRFVDLHDCDVKGLSAK